MHNERSFSQRFPLARWLPDWHSPLYGYALIVPLVLLLVFTAYMVWWQHVPITTTHLYMLILLIVTITATTWGVGPSLCLLLMGVGGIIDLFIQPLLLGRLFPQAARETFDTGDAWSISWLVWTGAAIILIVHQREQARIYAQQQERLSRAAQHHLEEFISIICHELKTPLAGTLGNIQFARRKMRKYLLPLSEQAHIHRTVMSLMKILHYAEQSVTLETRLVDDLLDASRIQRKTFQIQRRECNLVDCIDRAIMRFEGICARERIVWNCPTHPVLVCGDPDRLEQVASNYLSNAFKYGRESAPVIVTLIVDQHTARVAVHNEGPGLSTEEQRCVWERFYRGQASKEGINDEIPHVGLGIGLSLCWAIVERHGGQVGVESVPGEGASFWFSLPYGYSCGDDSPETMSQPLHSPT
ncbi:sensor histidine kinase [Dictyobacter halimunensis]|uniref:sensor histidine kinase n=1 Tax=Dictyobacter halimunensis TaxID=3026934 RepID=UPI0030C6A9F7